MTNSSKTPLNIVEILRDHCHNKPNELAYTFLSSSQEEEFSTITYAELDYRARVIGGFLQNIKAAGKRAILLYNPGAEYVEAFLGCLYAGVIAVPAYPPRRNRQLPQLKSIVHDSQASIILTSSEILLNRQAYLSNAEYLENFPWIATDNLTSEFASVWTEHHIQKEELAYLQYTSGSTSNPKGVMITHNNVLHYLSFLKRFPTRSMLENLKGVWWMPPFHDAGLVGGILQPLYDGFPMVLISPSLFIQQPFRWLKAISDTRATFSAAPNFAYELCARVITAEQRESLDLSCWKMAFNSAEPIRYDTLTRFSDAFKSSGFRMEWFLPGYALAEATLLVTSKHDNLLPTVKFFDREALNNNQVIELKSPTASSIPLVGSGKLLGIDRLLIVHPEKLESCSEGLIGEIWISAATVAQGYWNRPEETNIIFRAFLSDTGEGPFLRTGDLGFLLDDELFITGRVKDMIIVRGRNCYPQDIELTVASSHELLTPDTGAAFSIELDGEERLVVIQELGRNYRSANYDELIAKIRHALVEVHDVSIYCVGLVKSLTIPRTTSGKIQRNYCKSLFLSDSLDFIYIWKSETNILPSQSNKELSWQSLDAIQNKMIYLISAKLNISVEEIDINKSFVDYGLDSLALVTLVELFSNWFGAKVEITDFWNFPTIKSLSEQIFTRHDSQIHANNRALANISSDSQIDGESSQKSLDNFSNIALAELLAEEIKKSKNPDQKTTP